MLQTNIILKDYIISIRIEGFCFRFCAYDVHLDYAPVADKRTFYLTVLLLSTLLASLMLRHVRITDPADVPFCQFPVSAFYVFST